MELDIADFDLVSIEGRVAPEFEVSIDALDFVDLPGLLQDESTVMDFRNPQIYLRVENQTALRVQFDNITMRALKDGQDEPLAEVSFGQGQATTEGDAIIGSGQPYRLCISSLGAATEVDSDVKVPTLSQLLRTVPDRIEVVDIQCSVVDEDVCVELGRTFGFSITYDVVCPLTFGPELQLCYRDSLKDIHANLPEQIVDVKHMQLTTTVENTVPLDLSIEFVPFDTLGLPIQNVTATVSTYARAGSQAQPTSTELTVDIVSTEGYIDNLDGLELIIYARPEEGNTVTINEAQRIKFLDAVLRIIGGVTVDLN